MPRSKRDDMKRNIGQAVNHLAAAVLDINEVYKEFKTQAETFNALPEEEKKERAATASVTHEDYAQYLETCMINISKTRDAVLSFAQSSWNLNEDQLIKYT